MLTTYDTKFHLLPDIHEKTRFWFSVGPQGIVSMSSHDFDVKYDDGKAFVTLFRNLDAKQMRELGEELIAAATDLEHQHEQFQQGQTFISNNYQVWDENEKKWKEWKDLVCFNNFQKGIK